MTILKFIALTLELEVNKIVRMGLFANLPHTIDNNLSYRSCIMKVVEHGNYTIEVKDKVLIVDAHGPFTKEIMEQYKEDIKKVTHYFTESPWGSLVTYYGNGVFTPEAEEALVKITNYRVNRGMIANATVFIDSANADLQQMQLSRVYQNCNVVFHVFSDINHANQWLTDFLHQ